LFFVWIVANLCLMKIFVPAKLNLTLKVTGKRPDGYHLLESEVVFLSLCDELEFELAPKLEVNSDIENNIIIKAARALDANKGAKITLSKNIPMGGGLGGGSADAAATLVALNQLWGLNKPEAELYDIALKLGADVPVCLYGHLNKVSSARFEGIGEVLTPYSAPKYYYLLVNPNIHLATVDVFNQLKGRNNLQEPAIELCPEVGDVLEFLQATQNRLFARMSGSGATCFAVFKKMEDAAKAAESVPNKWWKCTALQHSY
jgi:4-diphosphocytidyl-2-C-methyl-D-erythritol kinase